MQDNRSQSAKDRAAKTKGAYSKLLEKQAEERSLLENNHTQDRSDLRKQQTKEREDLLAKQAEERTLFRTETRGKNGNLRRVAEYQGGRFVLYRRPWTDKGNWSTFCLSQMLGGKRTRMFTFGWNGSRISQNGDTVILKTKFDPGVLTWVKQECKRSS